MKKILFLYCGGTIGQVSRKLMIDGIEQEVYFPPESDSEFLSVCGPIIKQIESEFDVKIDFELVTTKDSSNISPKDWQVISNRIAKAQDDDGYHAVGIAHGTDTLAYTATALALSLHGTDPNKSGLSIPVVLTGSQNSIHVSSGDGRFNFYNLFQVLITAIDNNVADVMVSFWNRVLLGCRTSKVSEKEFDAFQSLMFPDVGTINALGVKLHTQYLRKKSEAAYQMDIANKFGQGVVTFEMFPGFDPNIILKTVECTEVKAVVLRTYGSGNIPFEEGNNFESLIKTLTGDKEIPVVLATKFSGGSVSVANYDVGVRAVEAGAIQSLDHTSAAIEVKIQWLLGNELFYSVDGFKKAFHTSFAGEVTV
jgi:L-asparaginase